MKNQALKNCEGFQWDKGNLNKNWIRHNVSNVECEQVFFNKAFLVVEDSKHSQKENRWFALGRTNIDRHLFIVFTVRKNLIRVISAREMNKKEKRKYNEQAKKNTEV